jgi:hypothetical protein
MAEARAAINIFTQRKFRLNVNEHGITITIHIPHPRDLKSSLYRRGLRFGSWYVGLIYPVPLWGLAIIAAYFVYVCVTADGESWWRNGWLAHFLWTLDEFFCGGEWLRTERSNFDLNWFYHSLPPASPWQLCSLPTDLRVGYLAAFASAVILCLLMSIHHLLLRVL